MLLSEAFESARARFEDARSDLYDAAVAELVAQVLERHPFAARLVFEADGCGTLASTVVLAGDGSILAALGPVRYVQAGPGRSLLDPSGEPVLDCDPLSEVLDVCWTLLGETSGDPVEDLELVPVSSKG